MDTAEHGDRCKDKISGYKGIVVAITTWMNGCRRITIQAEDIDKDGKPIAGETFDEPQIEILKKHVIPSPNAVSPPVAAKPTGGPRPEPIRQKKVG